MVFKVSLSDFLVAALAVLQRSISLVRSPYKTMRSISADTGPIEIGIVFAAVFVYFAVAAVVKPASAYLFAYPVFLFHFFAACVFFYILASTKTHNLKLYDFISTLSYALIPTLVFFVFNTVVYSLLPPPRTVSVLGKMFSMAYITVALSLFFWKLVLVFLALRFSGRAHMYRVTYHILLFVSVFLPYSALLYQLRLFRIPFI